MAEKTGNGSMGKRCNCEHCRRHDVMRAAGFPVGMPIGQEDFQMLFPMASPAPVVPEELAVASAALDVANVAYAAAMARFGSASARHSKAKTGGMYIHRRRQTVGA